jgi:hypothetical protein
VRQWESVKRIIKNKASVLRISSDLIDRGYGCSDTDYLKCTNPIHKYTWIVTNPPYKHGLEFAKKALNDANNVAFLMKLNWLESVKRKRFLRKIHQVKS